ncbi:amidohydrolase family protein [Candidatus Litorirhabdus singularis]|uniref:amidohydrolase family protein n=1 Tax=Candidatus Litorirhabdus singularis TaxID=2518993 RepID=UPI00242FADF5|nr:amidohydrolase family protein [Candidatus Litorirhabdus singularis]
MKLNRRKFLTAAGVSAGAIAVTSCDSPPSERYNQADIDNLATQRLEEEANAGQGLYGRQVYAGYRGLAELPWFELDPGGSLICTDVSVPLAIDVHSHLGMSVLMRPALDLQASTERVMHLLDCDSTNPGCELDLDIYVNGNFTPDALSGLRNHTIAQGIWGSRFAATQTIPNLLREMEAMRVQHAMLLPIKLGLPFGDSLTEDWRTAVSRAGVGNRLHVGLSVEPGSATAVQEMRAHAAAGGRIMKLHPTVQRFYPDDPAVMDIYAEAETLGLVIFYHGGRAGIEPESSHPFAMPRHYEAPLAEFPRLQFILGHAGARDSAAMLELAIRYDNAWLGIHGQSLTFLETIIQRTGGQRVLFGTDWPFYHIAASLAKVLIVTDTAKRATLRHDILRGNALQLLSWLAASN